MGRLVGIVSLLLIAGFVSSACKRHEKTTEYVDRALFHHFGITFFHKPTLVPMKEVHLEAGRLAGKELLVKGVILEIGQNGTFFVLSDQTARLLVVLTDLEDAGTEMRDSKPRMVQVIGTVQSGKKGLPYLRASSLNVLQVRKS